MIEKYFLLMCFGMIRLITVAQKSMFSITILQMVKSKWKKLLNRTQG